MGHNDDGTKKDVNFDGTDTEVFGLGLFVKLPGPGVSIPLQVRYWYTPTSKIGDKDVAYSHVEGTSAPAVFTTDKQLFLKQDLVVIQDLVPKRTWNPTDLTGEFVISRVASVIVSRVTQGYAATLRTPLRTRTKLIISGTACNRNK